MGQGVPAGLDGDGWADGERLRPGGVLLARLVTVGDEPALAAGEEEPLAAVAEEAPGRVDGEGSAEGSGARWVGGGTGLTGDANPRSG